VLARVDVLDPAERQALQAASVLGQRFAPDALRHLLGNPRYGCERLVAHHLVRPEGEEDFLFAHALIQEGVYASLLHARRRELHRHAAVWYAGRDPVLHAEHLDRAEDPAAPQAYALAGRAEAAAYRNGRALQLTERGLLLANRQDDIHTLTCMQGEILQDLGAVAEATAAYERALAAAKDEAERCRAWIGVAAGMRETARYEAGLSVLERAEAAAAGHGLVTELARVHWLRGNMYFATGDTDGCLREQELALASAQEVRSPDLEARALSGLGDAYYARGQLLSAHHYFRRCLALCRVHGFGRIEVANLHMAAMVRCYADGLPGARDDALAAVERAWQVGHPRSELAARIIASFILYDMAELEQAREQVERARELALRLGARRYGVPVLVYTAKILVAEGRVPEACSLLEQAAALSSETGPGYFGARTLSELALVTAEREAQQRTLGEAERLLRRGAISSNSLWYYRNAIEAALLAGDWQEAERLAAALESYNRPEPLPWADLFVVRGRVLATYGRGGREEAALQQLRTARDMAFRLGLKVALPALQEALAEA
jgi:tetratricopeptide (TPR) repeat protein